MKMFVTGVGGRILLAVTLLFCSANPAHSQSSASSTSSDSSSFHSSVTWYTWFERIPEDWSEWGTVSFRSDQVNTWVGVGISTAVLFAADDAIYSPSQRLYETSPTAKRWADIFAAVGDGRTQFALAGAYAAYGLLWKDGKAFGTGSEIVEAVLASGGVVQVLKHVTGRESPYVRSKPTGRWSFFPNQVDYHRYVPYFDAFPSGHICTSIATVIVIAENYPGVSWARPVGYAVTTLVGIGMGTNGIHWYSDYPLGLFIGYTFGMVAAHPEWYAEGKSGGAGEMELSVLPTYSVERGTGISFSVRF